MPPCPQFWGSKDTKIVPTLGDLGAIPTLGKKDIKKVLILGDLRAIPTLEKKDIKKSPHTWGFKSDSDFRKERYKKKSPHLGI